MRVSYRPAGEGFGRTARVYVSEESHRGIVPMKHSNKDGTLSAESAEGRLRLKENALHLTRTRLSAGLSVSHGGVSVRTGCAWPLFSKRRTGCAKERPSGSVRGAPGDRWPYRDQQLRRQARYAGLPGLRRIDIFSASICPAKP